MMKNSVLKLWCSRNTNSGNIAKNVFSNIAWSSEYVRNLAKNLFSILDLAMESIARTFLLQFFRSAPKIEVHDSFYYVKICLDQKSAKNSFFSIFSLYI